jgi:BMFP domain-containing protein YqiC
MSERYIKREKLDAVEAQLKSTDEARIVLERERDQARAENAQLRARIAELEAAQPSA